MTKINFEDKHILISGGSSGIGFALAKEFSKIGAHVTLLARRKELLEEAVECINNYRQDVSQRISFISADVTHYRELLKKLNLERKRVDVLINSAGIAYPGIFMDMEQQTFSHVMDVNYMGTVNLTKILLPEMVQNNWGYIVNISSLAALIGIYGYTAYAPSKYAVRGFSRCLRAEIAPLGINVSIVLPPDTDTPQLAYERQLLPEITRMINENGGVLTPGKVARAIIQGMRRKKFTIIPGLEGKLLFLLAPIIGRYFYHFAVRKQK